jgi:hypothetical protein
VSLPLIRPQLLQTPSHKPPPPHKGFFISTQEEKRHFIALSNRAAWKGKVTKFTGFSKPPPPSLNAAQKTYNLGLTEVRTQALYLSLSQVDCRALSQSPNSSVPCNYPIPLLLASIPPCQVLHDATDVCICRNQTTDTVIKTVTENTRSIPE